MNTLITKTMQKYSLYTLLSLLFLLPSFGINAQSNISPDTEVASLPTSLIEIDCSVTNPTSNPGATDGSITLTITGVTTQLIAQAGGSITFINDGDGTYTLSDLSGGSYEVTVTDNEGNIVATCIAVVEDGEVDACDNPLGLAGEDQTICSGETTTIGCEPIAGYCYFWEPTTGFLDPTMVTSSMPEVSPDETMTYSLTITDDEGDVVEEGLEVVVTVIEFTVDLGGQIEACPGETVLIEANILPSDFPYTIFYDWEGLGEDLPIIDVIAEETTSYNVRVISEEGQCEQTAEVDLIVNSEPDFSFIPETPMICSDGINQEVIIQLSEDYVSYNWSDDSNGTTFTTNTIGTYEVTVTDENECTKAKEVEVIDANDPDKIKSKLEEKGFYSTTIKVMVEPVLQANYTGCGDIEDKTEGNIRIKYQGEYIDLCIELDNILATNRYSDYEKKGFVTNNKSLCDDPTLFDNICSELNSQEFGYWAHIFYENPDLQEGEGTLYLRCKTPALVESFSPVDDTHKSYLDGLTTLTVSAGVASGFDNLDQQILYVHTSNLLYDFIPEDYSDFLNQNADKTEYTPPNPDFPDAEFQCGQISGSGTNFFVSPAGIQLVAPSSVIPRFGMRADVAALTGVGALVGFTTTSTEDKNFIYKGIAKFKDGTPIEFLGYQNATKGGWHEYTPLETQTPGEPDVNPYLTWFGQKIGNTCPDVVYTLQQSAYINYDGFQNNNRAQGDLQFIFDGYPNTPPYTPDIATGEIRYTNSDKRIYNTCLPDIDPGDFITKVNGFSTGLLYNYSKDNPNQQGKGYVIHVPLTNVPGGVGDDAKYTAVHVFYDTQLGLNQAQYHVYNCANGTWVDYFPVTSEKTLIERLTGVVKELAEFAHISLDIVGFVPLLGEPADFLNGVLYIAEGNQFEAAMSFAAIIPVAGAAVTNSKFVVKYGGKVVKSSKKAIRIFKNSDSYKVFDMNNGGITMKDLDYTPEEAADTYKWMKQLEEEDLRKVLCEFIPVDYLLPSGCKNHFQAKQLLNAAGMTKRSKDVDLQAKFFDLAIDGDFMGAIGGSTNNLEPLIAIIKQNKCAAPFSTKNCKHGGPHLKSLVKYLDDLKDYTNKGYHLIPGGGIGTPGKKGLLALTQTGTPKQIDEVAQTIRRLREQGPSPNEIARIGKKFDNASGHRFDIELKDDAGYIEFKSYNEFGINGDPSSIPPIPPLSEIDAMKPTGQLGKYLSKAPVTDDSILEYSFDIRKLSKFDVDGVLINPSAPYDNPADAFFAIKTQFNMAIQNNSQEFFDLLHSETKINYDLDNVSDFINALPLFLDDILRLE